MAIDIHLRAGYRDEPLGIPTRRGVMLSWNYSGEGAVDLAQGVTVEVADNPAALKADAPLWRREAVQGTTVLFDHTGLPDGTVTNFAWRVTAWDTEGNAVQSEIARFESGIEDPHAWNSEWISAPLDPLRRETWEPIPLFRRKFTFTGSAEGARLFVTALGVYRLWLNGEEVTAQSWLRPGWSDFHVRALHQTYDISSTLRQGENVVAVELSKGWYAGWLGLQREPGFYGDQTALRLQAQVGDQVLVATDSTWVHATGDILMTDLLRGETQDLRQTQDGWQHVGFDDSSWRPVLTRSDIDIAITPQPHNPAHAYREYPGKLVRAHARGPAVFDFGQNVVGWTRVDTRTHAKADLVVRHAERLTVDDLAWRDNLRGAFQEDRYTTGDDQHHTLEPRHTLHGFQFAEVWGLATEVPHKNLEVPDDFSITAIAVSGGQEPAGTFECSDDQLTQVSRLVEWTVRDNFIEVITDCPQRDERLGWLGDAGVISQSAAYHFDVAAFLQKFLQDATDSQDSDGMIKNYVPPVPPSIDRDGAPGWADGYVRLVYLAAERYADLTTVNAHIDSVKRYLDRVEADNPSGIRTERVGADFADWLSLPEDPNEPAHPGFEYTGSRSTSSRRVVGTAHTIRSFDEYAQLLEWLGRDEDAAAARTRADEIRATYIGTFIDDRGWIEGDTQTVYAQAINWGIVTGELRAKVAARLAQKVRDLGHVTVGIHGSQHILPALVDTGYADLAEQLLLRPDMPSWKFMVSMGATTIWEKWDAFRTDGTHSTAEMNSLNHCALGAVGEFLFERVAGLNARSTSRTNAVRIAPVYFSGLNSAAAEHNTIAGPATSSWKREGKTIVHDLTLSPGLRATFVAPAGWAVEGEGSTVDLGPGQHRLILHAR